uniref:Homeobox domain-containing protein n=1 Tax=Leersia perrieri TaxID=77586 RepID=A0A0D9WTN8_9ORYZ
MYSPSRMEGEEDLGAWLGLAIGGGEALSPVKHVKEERRRCSDDHGVHDQQSSGSNKMMKGEKGARLRMMRNNNNGDGVLSLSCEGGGTRKKLQLTKEQSTLLENSFRLHNILSHAQKHEIARQLKLKPRQVEVWFQNRRARTKLKQTEVDCEFLKRCCKSLREENQQLKHELMELQRLAAAAQLYVPFPRSSAAAAMVNICPSCDKITMIGSGEMAAKSSSSYSSE